MRTLVLHCAFFALIGLVLSPLAARASSSSTGQSNEPISTFYASDDGIFASVAFSPDGRLLALEFSPDSSEFELWDVSAGRAIANFSARGVNWWYATFSPDGQRLAGSTDDGTIELWDVSGGVQHSTTISAYEEGYEFGGKISFSPDGRRLASTGWSPGGLEVEFKLWDLSHGVQRVATIINGPIFLPVFSPNGRLLASHRWEESGVLIELWDLSRGVQRVATISTHANYNYISSFSFSSDGSLLAWAGDRWVSELGYPENVGDETEEIEEVKVWDVSTGQSIATLAGSHPVSFSPKGRVLASASASKTKHFWEKDFIISQVDGARNIELWDVSTGQSIATLPFAGGELGSRSASSALVFSPDGRLLASMNRDAVQLWDVSEWIPHARLTPDPSEVAFSADDPAWKTFTVHTSLDSVLVRANPSGSDPALEVSGGQQVPTRDFCPAEGNDRPSSGRRDGLNLHVKACQAGQTKLLLIDYDTGEVLQQYEINVEASTSAVASTALNPSYPNPFNSETVLSYTLPTASAIRLEVFTLSGQRVAVLHEGFQAAGYHTVAMDASDLASGVYLYRLSTPEGRFTQKFTLLR